VQRVGTAKRFAADLTTFCGTRLRINHRVEQITKRLERVREIGDRLTGGGVRALARCLLRHVQHTGNRITGGGLRSLSRRTLAKSIRIAERQPFLQTVGRRMLQAFPRFSEYLYRLAYMPHAEAAASSLPDLADHSPSLPDLADHSLLTASLYKSAFGRPVGKGYLSSWEDKLRSGMSVEDLAGEFVASAEFQGLHGSSETVDIKYVTALYRNGLGRPPSLECLAYWLGEGEKGATRATVLTEVAGSNETRANVHSTIQAGMDYNQWVAVFDTISDADRAVIRSHIAGLPFRPLISVIMPIGATSGGLLYGSIVSVVKQLYPYWELFITGDALQASAVKPLLRDHTRDPRIHVNDTTALASGGIAAAMNAALESASGEFVTFLRPGDILAEHALYETVYAFGGNEQADVVYGDLDYVDSDGHRENPWFKPGWDPDLLLGQDYVNDLAVYRRILVESVGRLRTGFDGAEFHDLALRTTASTTADRVRHVPSILYHRLDVKHSVHEENALTNLRAIDASRRAVRYHLDAMGYANASIRPAPQLPSATRVVWDLPMPEPLVSVIIPTRDRADLLAQCVEGVLHRTDYSNLELLIVDNDSVELPTLTLFDELTEADKRIRILHYPGPFNYSALNNFAAREANGEVLLLLNNDISVIESGWLRELVSQAIRPDVGIAGAKLLYADERLQHGGIVLGPEGAIVHALRLAPRNDPGYFGQLALVRTLSAVTGACAAIRRSVLLEAGGFDEANLPVRFNDVDLCLRLGDYGYRVVWTPFAELFHLESASRGLDADPAKRTGFLREWRHLRKTWGNVLNLGDPFHNPNLLFSWERFEIPVWPRRSKPWREMGEQIIELRQHFGFVRDVK
jgi:GT2 family glycosyltransferase